MWVMAALSVMCGLMVAVCMAPTGCAFEATPFEDLVHGERDAAKSHRSVTAASAGEPDGAVELHPRRGHMADEHRAHGFKGG